MTAPVRVRDQVVLPVHAVESWLARWRLDYLPGAVTRGMTLIELRRAYTGVGAVALDIVWELPDIYAFYGMRGAAGADAAVVAFWADTDAIAVFRDRRTVASEEVWQ